MDLASTGGVVTLERMTDEDKQAAIEAAQRVVEEVSSWQYSADDGMKDEQSSAPQVVSATPVE